MMQKLEWHSFDPKGKLPSERRPVLVKIDTQVNEHGGVAVGYLRYAAGDSECPYFVCPAINTPWTVTHWCDCLGDDFNPPGWKLPGKPLARLV